MTVLTTTGSKPDAIKALESVWRKTREHYQAQVIRFLAIFGGLIVTQAVADISNHKQPFAGITSLHSLLTYLIPIAYVAYRQWKPSMNATRLDSAPGATIVPEQVGLPSGDPGVDTTPTGAASADGVPAPDFVPEGDAAP